jgi:transcriptional regulator with XRE-family HTH domain
MHFGDRIKELREQAELTQTALAKAAGVNLRTLQGWEQYRRVPVSADLFKVLKVLGKSADLFADDDLRTREKQKPPKKPRRKKGE